MPLFTKAQNNYLYDISGKPFREINYTDIEGSPFLTETWVNGFVKLSNGKTYSDIQLKYDQVSDELLFRNKNNQTLSFVDRVAEFKLIYLASGKPVEKIFKSGFSCVDPYTQNTFYEILYDGELSLLKRTTKKINEVKPFNSSTAIRSFIEVQSYYLSRKGELQRLKKDKKTLLSLLSDKKDPVEKFIDQNKLNLKDDAQLISVIGYYNSL